MRFLQKSCTKNQSKMEKHKWEIFDEMPHGWKIDKTAGSPQTATVFITNGKSVLNGQKRALLRVQKVPIRQVEKEVKVQKTAVVAQKENYEFPAKSFNILARKKFQEHFLQEIRFDLMVCQIEGWSKVEYIRELKALIDSINLEN